MKMINDLVYMEVNGNQTIKVNNPFMQTSHFKRLSVSFKLHQKRKLSLWIFSL